MNNLSVHVASSVNEYWVNNRIKILTIVPYCSNLNQMGIASA